MLSPPDIAIIGALALIFFGPDQLPKVARKAGQVMRDVQNTSATFIREMERAADDIDLREAFKSDSPDGTMMGPRPPSERLADPSPAIAHQVREPVTKAEGPAAPGVAHEDASGI